MAAECVEVNGERIAFRRTGEGPAVLLIHSLGTHSGLWASTFAALLGQFSLVAMDCRGHGGSTNRGGFSVAAVAQDGRALMDQLGHERFHVVGISMGGLMAVTLAAAVPDRVASLFLTGAYAGVGAAGPPRLAATRALLAGTAMAAFGAAYAADTVLPDSPEAARALVANAIAGMSAADYLDTLEAILTADVSALLPTLDVPALVLTGQEDRRAPEEVGRRLSACLPQGAFEVMPGAGHLAVLDRPAAFNQRLVDFLTQAGRRRSGCSR
ncbi:alpha/beta fold hydrolase [Xanthobacter sp. KR7-225]|uniref:alpha/beta fold hydrolase n=1 Tax=Xanthobacter sp. KR7-225 TaxID=3156613 RepID=UPI0032B55EED